MKALYLHLLSHQNYIFSQLSLLLPLLLMSLLLSACSVQETTNDHLESSSGSKTGRAESESMKDLDSTNTTPNDVKSSSDSSSNNSTSPSDDTSISSEESTANEADTIIPLETYTVTESSIEGYHDLITELQNLQLSIDLQDMRLDSLKNYLSNYDFNFTNHQIGQILEPTSLLVLCNKLNQLPKDYVPNNLRVVEVPFTFSEASEKKMLREEAATALELLFKEAKEAGFDLFALSGYRSYTTQINNYTSRVDSRGQAAADKISARPGHSEHQTGLAMDVTSQSASFKLIEAFGETPEGLWIKEHAHTYGFIIRYQKETTDITGYSYEPWHLRYITTEVASYLYEANITLEELYAMLLGK